MAGSPLCIGGAVATFRALMKKAQAVTRTAAKLSKKSFSRLEHQRTTDLSLWRD